MNTEAWAKNIFDEIKKQRSIEDVEKLYNENLELVEASKDEYELEVYILALEKCGDMYIKLNRITNEFGSVLEKMDESQTACQTNKNVKRLLELIKQTKEGLK